MEKYYTPELSEFHVGFEYERFQYPDKWEKDKIVEKDFCQMDDAWGNVFDEISNFVDGNKIRVKYLDHEDILECGWNREMENTFTLNGFGINFPQISKDGLRIFTKDGTVFDGTIRNKSELLVLMKQLNIA